MFENNLLELNFLNWSTAFLPLLMLLVTMIVFKWSAPRAGFLAWIIACLFGWLLFGADGFLLAVACAKGLSLTLFVLLIIWAAVFMYNLIDGVGGIEVIGRSVSGLVKPRLGQALLLAWAFSGFVEGIAGFGVPVAVVAPLMLILGFSPVMAASSVLIGHSWAVTFGAMGAAYYTIQLVTDIPGNVIGPVMAVLFALPIIATGFCVAHIEGGWPGLRKGSVTIIITGILIALTVWLMSYIGAAQIASVVPGLVGCAAVLLLSKKLLNEAKTQPSIESKSKVENNRLNFHMAFLPYYLLILLTILSQIPLIKETAGDLYFGLDYPRLETSLGYVVEPVKAYAKIGLLSHPAPLIIITCIVTYVVFIYTGHWKRGAGIIALKTTVRQCVPTSLGIVTMVMMALIMISTGMTEVLAYGIAKVTGVVFPVFSPYIGVLGCFITGSNTNSNIMFGGLQVETALSLGVSPLIIASLQSIGGSLGSAIAPAKVLIGSTIVGLVNREGDVMHKVIPYCLAVVLLVGLEGWLAAYILSP